MKGQPPLIPANLRAVCREVLGLDNLAIRKRLQRWYETGDAGGADHGAGLGSATFRHILQMGYGLPKHAMESGDKTRPPVIFIGKPWDPNNPINQALDARSAAMIKAKNEQLALEAADRKAAEVIDVTATPGEPEEEGLERVIPPPNDDPTAFR